MPRTLALALVLPLTACGGSSGSPAAPTPPAPQDWTLAGSLVDIISNEAIGGATMSFAGYPAITTSGSGAWSVRGTGTSAARMTVSVEAPGYLGRDTGVSWSLAGRGDIRLNLIPDRAPFSLGYFREFVRNGLEAPETLEPLRRWTRPPNFYVNATNPKTNEPLTATEIETIERVIRDAVPQLTGGQFAAGTIEVAAAAREPRFDYISITFTNEPEGDYCGKAYVARNPGEITINYERCRTPCGNFPPETLAHEVGHAMGYYHTQGSGIMNTNRPNRAQRCANTQFSSDEHLHARVAYSRAPGNLDVDMDPTSFSAIEVPGDAPLVVCRR